MALRDPMNLDCDLPRSIGDLGIKIHGHAVAKVSMTPRSPSRHGDTKELTLSFHRHPWFMALMGGSPTLVSRGSRDLDCCGTSVASCSMIRGGQDCPGSIGP